MNKDELAALIESEGEAIEANPDAPITDTVKVTRGHSKTRTLQVRLLPDEYEALEAIAEERGLPVSTVAREQLQKLLKPAASQAESALEALINSKVEAAMNASFHRVDALRMKGIGGMGILAPSLSPLVSIAEQQHADTP